MTKKQILIAATAAVVGVVIVRNLKVTIPPIPEPPPLSPELQAWVDYVERYPNLEDDPKIKHAIELLEEFEDPE